MGAVTLQTIVDAVGAGIIDVVRAPAGLDAAVGEIVINDPIDRRAVEFGDLILAVGVDPSDREATALVRRAGAGGAAAVIFKLGSDAAPAAVLDASAETGVALLGVAREMVWGQIHALMRTACAAAGAPLEVGPGGAPVGDLFALANAVASMVGGATTIEDTRSTVLAYSSTGAPIDEPRRRTILGRQVPEDWLQRLNNDGVFHRIWAGDVVRVDYTATDAGSRVRLAVAVRAGGEILGSIWVIEGDRPLGEVAEAALAEAGRLAALHLIRHRAGDDLERRRRAELLRSVLDGRTPPQVLASSLAVPVACVVTVVAFGLQSQTRPGLADQAVLADRAVNLITIHCQAYQRQAATVGEGRTIHLLLVDQGEVDAGRLTSFVTSVVEHLTEQLKVGVRAGIGPSVAGFDNLLFSNREADQALRVLADEPAPAIAHINAIRSRAILLYLRDLTAQHPGLRSGTLDRLVTSDRERGTVYVPTLRAYLDAFGDITAAATTLDVHPNTFRYRLRRLLDLAELDLAIPGERLVAHLQLTFLDGQ